MRLKINLTLLTVLLLTPLADASDLVSPHRHPLAISPRPSAHTSRAGNGWRRASRSPSGSGRRSLAFGRIGARRSSRSRGTGTRCACISRIRRTADLHTVCVLRRGKWIGRRVSSRPVHMRAAVSCMTSSALRSRELPARVVGGFGRYGSGGNSPERWALLTAAGALETWSFS